jgi:hypothetical protein
LKLKKGGIPPDAMTVTYVAAKGISLSTELALSLAMDIGTTMNPIMMYAGIGTSSSRGKNWKKYVSTIAMILTGKVRRASRNIRETYVSG